MKLKHLTYCLIFIFTITLCAQDNKPQKKPKIGLVLSGGGAKGFAHIGVLKVLDSLNIKVDYIAGTSMGAVIGSLYAAGYTGKQLEAMFNTQDFNALINDEFPRASQSLYERQKAQRYAISLPFDGFKIKFPSSLSKGQNVYNLLSQLMLPVDGISDFKNLPIPFFCIATNIETGESLIMDKGRLVDAVTASAALPSLFQPVVIDNQILIDGGVTNNFPVAELRAKGMDYIIGVDVQDGLRDRAQLQSGLDVLLQINNFRTINAMKSKVALTDVYIKPDITNFSVLSFNQGQNIITNGEAAAKKNYEALNKLKALQQNNPKRVPLKITDSITIKNINITNSKRYSRAYLAGKLKLKPNQTISYKHLNKGIQSLMATNNFDIFNYQLKPTNIKNEYNLEGKVREAKSTTALKFGIHYDALYKGAALANITKKRLLFNNDIASLDIILGDESRYNFEYFIDKGYYISIGVKSWFNQFHKNVNPYLVLDEDSPVASGLNKVDVEINDFTNQVYMQTIFQKDMALRLGAEYKRLKIESETLVGETNNSSFIFENTGYFSLFGNLHFDSYDHALFPKKGLYFNGELNWYIGASKFNTNFKKFAIANAHFGYAFSVSNKLAFNVEAQGGFKFGSKTTSTLDFALGGYGQNLINNYHSFYGYDYLSLFGDSFVKAAVTLDYEIFKKHHLQLAANFANIEDDIFTTTEWLSAPDFSGYALGYAMKTFIGPLEAKYTFSPETNESYWFFNLGFWF